MLGDCRGRVLFPPLGELPVGCPHHTLPEDRFHDFAVGLLGNVLRNLPPPLLLPAPWGFSRMSTVQKILCRPCKVSFKVVSEETGDVECPACGVWFEGGVLEAFLDYEHSKVVSEAIAEIRPLPSGQQTIILRRNLIEHLRERIATVGEAD